MRIHAISPRFWRAARLLVRLDIAADSTVAAALFLLVTWH
jgi:hypothetical protein